MTNFIEIYRDVYPEGFCEHVIAAFEDQHANGLTFNRQQSDNASLLEKKDDHIFLNHKAQLPNFNGDSVVDIFYHGLQKTYNLYADKYPALKDVDIVTRTVKLQKVSPGGGYHIWHAEQGNGEEDASRCLTYMVYLNTLPELACGETEFLHQEKRINPVQNSIVFWPAAYTHPHRGNAVYGNEAKYIATGWFICV